MGELFKGDVAVVTGAGNGIGKAEALALAMRGARVIVNDIGAAIDGKTFSHDPADKVVAEIQATGGTALANYDSVSSEEGANNIIQSAIRNFGKIDILINNAGIASHQMIFDISTETWDAVIKTSLYGTFFCTRQASIWMKKQGYGRILNTSSHVGLGMSGCASYSAAKEGIVGFTRTVARDMGQFGVTCNAIRPIAAWRGTVVKDERIEHNRPEDIASLAACLVSQAADQINGCIFEVWRGHVGIYMDPPAVSQVLWKDGDWTTEELVKSIPLTLTEGRKREDLPFTLPFKPLK
jgi:3-oxoacyl-[acyl-carrier protein] reductase